MNVDLRVLLENKIPSLTSVTTVPLTFAMWWHQTQLETKNVIKYNCVDCKWKLATTFLYNLIFILSITYKGLTFTIFITHSSKLGLQNIYRIIGLLYWQTHYKVSEWYSGAVISINILFSSTKYLLSPRWKYDERGEEVNELHFDVVVLMPCSVSYN